MPRSCSTTGRTRQLHSFAGGLRLEHNLSGGVRWFHSGGIFAALSETTGELIIEAMRAARAVGAVVSFDLNYRQKLWNISGGQEKAVATCRRIIENVDVLVGNEEDLQTSPRHSWPGDRGAMGPRLQHLRRDDQGVLDAYPQVKVIGATLREVTSASHHRWSAVARSTARWCRRPSAI